MPHQRRARTPPSPLSLAPPDRPHLSTARSAPTSSSSSPSFDPLPPPQPAVPYNLADVLPVNALSDPSKKPHSAARSPTHTKRPPNSWILYRSDTLRHISRAKAEGREFVVPERVKAHPRWGELGEGGEGMPKAQSKASKLIGLMWSLESREVREGFERLSELRKAEHAQLFPNYKFQPRKSVTAAFTASTSSSSTVGPSSAKAPLRSRTRRQSAPESHSTTMSRLRTKTAPPSPPFAHPYALHDGAGERSALPGPIRSEKRSKVKRRKKHSSGAASAVSTQTYDPSSSTGYATPYTDRPHSYSTNPPLGSSSAAAAGVNISWAIPPPADAPLEGWYGYQQPTAWAAAATFASGGAEDVGLGIWPAGEGPVRGLAAHEETGSGHWQQSCYQTVAVPDPGPPTTFVSPALTADSFDSHPTPAPTYASHLAARQAPAYYSFSSESDEDGSVRYAEYEYTSGPWPNPIEGDDDQGFRQRSTTTTTSCGVGVGPAELVRHQYYEQAPLPTASVHESWPHNDDALHCAALPAPLPTWYDAALLATAGLGPVDPHGLAAMWCLLDDDGGEGGGSTTISPFLLDPADDDGGKRRESFDFGVNEWTTTAAGAAGLEGEWSIDYTLPEPTRQTLSALALDFGPVTGAVPDSAGWEDERAGRSDTDVRRPAKDDALDPNGQPLTRGHQHASPFHAAEPARPAAPPALPAESPQAPLAAAAPDVDAVTRDVGRVTVGVPRRNTRVVGGSFSRPPRLPASPPAARGKI